MIYVVVSAIVVIAVIIIVFFGYIAKNLKDEVRESESKIAEFVKEEDRNAERIEEKESIETGNNGSDFTNSVNLLHDISCRKSKK